MFFFWLAIFSSVKEPYKVHVKWPSIRNTNLSVWFIQNNIRLLVVGFGNCNRLEDDLLEHSGPFFVPFVIVSPAHTLKIRIRIFSVPHSKEGKCFIANWISMNIEYFVTICPKKWNTCFCYLLNKSRGVNWILITPNIYKFHLIPWNLFTRFSIK